MNVNLNKKNQNSRDDGFHIANWSPDKLQFAVGDLVSIPTGTKLYEAGKKFNIEILEEGKFDYDSRLAVVVKMNAAKEIRGTLSIVSEKILNNMVGIFFAGRVWFVEANRLFATIKKNN